MLWIVGEHKSETADQKLFFGKANTSGLVNLNRKLTNLGLGRALSIERCWDIVILVSSQGCH